MNRAYKRTELIQHKRGTFEESMAKTTSYFIDDESENFRR